MSDVRCNIANCNYAAKTIKTVENHRQKVHGITPDKSFMDQSVSFTTASIDDTGSLTNGSLDHKTSSDFYHDLSKVKQSTQLIEAETESDDEDEDEESDKKIKLGASTNRDADPQSQGTLERQVLGKEALASAKKRVDGLNTSESLLDDINVVKEFLADFTESQSENETMLTAREDSNTTELDETGEELRSLAKDLKLRTDSLHDALAQVENLKSKAAHAIREKEYLEAKAASKDTEIKSLTEKEAANQADADKAAADLALEEEEKVKEAEEVKEVKDNKKKEDEAKVDDDEEAKRKKERRDKVKLKRKRKRELRKAGAMEDSSPMDVDDDISPDNSHAAKAEPAAKKHKKQATSVSKAAKTATNAKAAASKSRANSVTGHTSSNFQTPLTQTQAPVQDPQLQHQIHPHQQPPSPPPQQQPPSPLQQHHQQRF